jgi:hypothetical protein
MGGRPRRGHAVHDRGVVATRLPATTGRDVSARDEDRGDSFEVDRHVDDQPERDDLLEPEDIDPEPIDGPTMDRETGVLPDPEDLPESQGDSVLDADRLAEDASSRRLSSDEDAEGV